MSELKNCPHCGNNDYLTVKRVEGETVLPDNFQVVCSWLSGGCGASGGTRRTKDEAIAAWNTRADDAQVIKNAENYKLADDSEPQVIANAEKYELADSRENLEADIMATDYPFVHTPMGFRDIRSWLDRQEAITYRECNDYVDELLKLHHARVNGLRAECDELDDDCERYRRDLNEIAYALGVEIADDAETHAREMAAIEKLTAERNELRLRNAELEAERCDRTFDIGRHYDKAKERVAELEAERDELRDELKHKQLVIDRQRDSFLKLEAENAELRRMLADAAEAI